MKRRLSSCPAAGQGMLAPTLGTILLLLFGSVALVAGGLAWQSASSRGGDAEQAREAAEWGFNSVIDQLNDPGNSYLLVTKWSASNRDWVAVTAAERSACRISTNSRGEVQRSSILSAVQTVGTRQVRYTLTEFRPPQYPGAEPSSCTKFGNLSGGTARLTVLGEVLQGGTVVASHRIVRDATVDAEGDNDLAAPPISPPMTFLATGSGELVSLEGADRVSRRPNFLYDRNGNWRGDSGDTRVGQIHCLETCSPSDLNTIAGMGRDGRNTPPGQRYTLGDYSLSSFSAMFPPSPPYSSVLDSVPTGNITSRNMPVNFPYSGSGTANLLSYCRLASLPTLSGTGEQVIGCKVSLDIGNDSRFIVHTDRSNIPVVLYLMGEGSHRVGDDSEIVNKRFVDTRSSDPLSWTALRIYGDPRPRYSFPITASADLDECADGDMQELEFGENSNVAGAMMWVPKGDVEFENHRPSSGLGFFGAIWVCKVRFGENFVLLSNGNPEDSAKGIDSIFGLTPLRYVAKGVERSL